MLALTGLVALAAAAYGVGWASYLPQFSLHEIRVVGAKEMRPGLVRAYVEAKVFNDGYAFLAASNIFLFPHTKVERALASYFPRIRSVKISRESLLATSIIVSIEERESFARWCQENRCFVMSGDGFIFAEAPPSALTLKPYIFRGELSTTTPATGQRYLSENFANVLMFLERLEGARFSPQEIITEDGDISVHLAQGFKVFASLGEDSNELVRNLELVLSSEALRDKEGKLEYVDLRFGNRVYYRLQ